MARYDLPRLRKKKNMTQRQLAEALGLSQGFLSSVESGRNPFPDERIDDLQSIFPEENIEDYAATAPQKPSSAVGSFNEGSEIKINDPATLKAFIAFATRQSKEVDSIEQTNGCKEKDYQERLLRLSDELEKVRKEKYDLLEENLRLKDLLRRNNIEFKDCTTNK